MSKKDLKEHLNELQPLLRKRKPEQFDNSPEAAKMKREIQAWNSTALTLLQATRGAKAAATAFADLGRMKYGSMVEVKAQLRQRHQIIDDYLNGAGKPRGHPPESPAPGKPEKRPVKGSKKYPFDVCLSFAGEDRKKVKLLNDALESAGVKIFYDKNEDISAALWGTDLVSYLDDIYQHRARHCVMFLSKHYVRKAWTNHERQSAQAREFFDQGYILPIRLDNTPVPGIRPTKGFKEWSEGIPTLTRSILTKLGKPLPQLPPASGSTRRKPTRETVTVNKGLKLTGHVVLLGQHLWQAEHLENIPGQHFELRVKVKASQLKILRALESPLYSGRKVPFVNGYDAYDVQVSILKETTSRGMNVVILKLVPGDSLHGSGPHRFSWNGLTATDLATTSTRQLLLGEQPQVDAWNSPPSNLPRELSGGVLAIAQKQAGREMDVLQLGKFLSIYHLHTQNIVDDINELVFKRLQNGKISVSFKGHLKQPYSNESGEVIVKGTITGIKG